MPPSSAGRARSRARPGSRSCAWHQPHHGLRRAGDAAAGRSRRRRPRAGAVGQPPRRPVRDQVGLEHGVTTPVFDALRRGEAEDLLTLAQKAASGSVSFRLPEGREPTRAQAAARREVARGIRDHRPAAGGPRSARQAPRRPEAAPVDLPHRRHRRHLRGHPAGPGRRPRGRRRHRRHPLHRAVAARLRARGRHPRGVCRHLRHPGELPPDAGGPRRDLQGARPLHPADQLRARACACPRSRPWPGSSGST